MTSTDVTITREDLASGKHAYLMTGTVNGEACDRSVVRAASNVLSFWAPPFAIRTDIALGGTRLSGIPGELVGSLALAAAPQHFVGLADGYVGYIEDPGRALRGEGEAGRTYYGPGLARALGVLEDR